MHMINQCLFAYRPMNVNVTQNVLKRLLVGVHQMKTDKYKTHISKTAGQSRLAAKMVLCGRSP